MGRKERALYHKTDGGHYDSLSELIRHDMSEMAGEHITLLDWLRRRDYQGIKYDQNQEA